MAREIRDLTELYLSKTEFSSLILHFSASEMLTKYSMACVFAEILGTTPDHLKKVDQIGETKTLSRPKNVELDVGCLKELGVNVETVDFRRWWTRKLTSG